MMWGQGSSSQRSPCENMLTALGKAHGFTGEMGRGPVVFPVWLWWCLRHLSPHSFCAFLGILDFLYLSVCLKSLLSQVLPSHGHTCGIHSAAPCHRQVSISSRMGSIGHLLHRCPSHKLKSWGTLVLPHTLLLSSLCCPLMQHPAGPGALGSVQPLAPVQHLHLLVCSSCPGVRWDLPVSVQFRRIKAMADIEMSSWETQRGPWAQSLQHRYLSKIPVLQSPLSEQERKLQASDYSGRRAHNSHLRNFFHHNQAFQEKGLKAWNSWSGIFPPGSFLDNTQEEWKWRLVIAVTFCFQKLHLGSGAGAVGNKNAVLGGSPFAISRLAVQGFYRF